jgi:murein peptide amidase A
VNLQLNLVRGERRLVDLENVDKSDQTFHRRIVSPSGKMASLIVIFEGDLDGSILGDASVADLGQLLDQPAGARKILRAVCDSRESVSAFLASESHVGFLSNISSAKSALVRQGSTRVEPDAVYGPSKSFSSINAGDRVFLCSSSVAGALIESVVGVIGQTDVQLAADSIAEIGQRHGTAPVTVVVLLFTSNAERTEKATGVPIDQLGRQKSRGRLRFAVVAGCLCVGGLLVGGLKTAAGSAGKTNSLPVAVGAVILTKPDVPFAQPTIIDSALTSPSILVPSTILDSSETSIQPPVTGKKVIPTTQLPWPHLTTSTPERQRLKDSWGSAEIHADCESLQPIAIPKFESPWAPIGQSREKRDIEARTIGSGSRLVLWVGGIHGDEIEGQVATEKLAEAMKDVSGLTESSTLVEIKDLNPDGRANRIRENSSGVDLNRNFPSKNFEPSANHGPSPLSEPEALLLARVVCSFRPDVILVSHSGHSKTLKNAVDPDGPADQLAQSFASNSGMKVSNADYPTPGSFGTWAGIDGNLAVLTVEFPRGLDPSLAWKNVQVAALEAIRG